jgi:hypothetical protein
LMDQDGYCANLIAGECLHPKPSIIWEYAARPFKAKRITLLVLLHMCFWGSQP